MAKTAATKQNYIILVIGKIYLAAKAGGTDPDGN